MDVSPGQVQTMWVGRCPILWQHSEFLVIGDDGVPGQSLQRTVAAEFCSQNAAGRQRAIEHETVVLRSGVWHAAGHVYCRQSGAATHPHTGQHSDLPGGAGARHRVCSERQ